MTHTLPPLPYATNALEPYMDEMTLKIHHGKHHQTYVDKLNLALKDHPELMKLSVDDLMRNIKIVPSTVLPAVRNFGGGVANHNFFWPLLKKDGGMPTGALLSAITNKWGSFDNFKKEFSDKATSLFGSGYTWLVAHQGNLEIINLPNQDSPLSDGKTPLLVVDVWEHAYYLKFQNRRAEFIETFFKIINWEKVSEHLKNAK